MAYGRLADGMRIEQARAEMSNITAALETSTLGLHPLDHYQPLIGAAATERILKKAGSLRALHVVHISSTFYGGGEKGYTDYPTLAEVRRAEVA